LPVVAWSVSIILYGCLICFIKVNAFTIALQQQGQYFATKTEMILLRTVIFVKLQKTVYSEMLAVNGCH